MSAKYAPKGPIQLFIACTAGAGADTLNDGSRGLYEKRLSAISTAQVIAKNPINSLRRRFSVGVSKRTRFSSGAKGQGLAAQKGRVGASARSPIGGTPESKR